MRSVLTCTTKILQCAWLIASARFYVINAREYQIAMCICIAVLAGEAWREKDNKKPAKVFMAVGTAAFVGHRDESVEMCAQWFRNIAQAR